MAFSRAVCCTPSTHVEAEQVMQTTEFTRASNIVIWNRWFTSFLGLWPPKVSQPRFVFFTVYMIIHCTMAMGHLIKNINDLTLVIENITESVLFVMLLGKLFICRRSCGIMATFLSAIDDDFSPESYNNAEKTAYLHYNEIALLFVKLSMSLTAFTATLFYLRGFVVNWTALSSGNLSYKILPYQVYPFFEVKDTSIYVCICIYLAIAVPIIICGYAGPDALVLGMALHICGQFAALSCKIDSTLKDHKNYHRHVNSLVLRHRHLITLAEILENNYNMIFLQQTLGTIFLLCLTLYNMIANSEGGDSTNGITFLLYTCCVVSTILAYCYIGECLITESAKIRDTFYNSDWYNNPPVHAKLISICMTRAEKPLILTAGKFCMLSLNTFTGIVKTSMAYLSMLRNFM